VVDVIHQGWRELHLLADQVVALEQPRQELAQRTVAQPFVERPFAGVDDGIAGAGLQRVGEGGGQLAEFPRLQVGGAKFVIGGETDGDDRHQQDQQDQPPPEPTLTGGLRLWRLVQRGVGCFRSGWFRLPQCAHSLQSGQVLFVLLV